MISTKGIQMRWHSDDYSPQTQRKTNKNNNLNDEQKSNENIVCREDAI